MQFIFYEIQLFEAEHVRVFIFQRYSINILKGALHSKLPDFKHLQREESSGGKRERRKTNKINNNCGGISEPEY